MEIKNIESVFMTSPVARINWASHVIMLNSSLPLGLSYWYMKQSVEMGWSSNVLKLQIDSDLYSRQISNNKVNNFTTTLPAPQSHTYMSDGNPLPSFEGEPTLVEIGNDDIDTFAEKSGILSMRITRFHFCTLY